MNELLCRTFISIVITCFALFIPGCILGSDGERAAGGCPSDEVCSPATPNGLKFTGRNLFDLAPVAVGGTQAISLEARGGHMLPAFEARIDDPSVVSVRPTDTAEITIKGERAGTAMLRILDPADGHTLLDRITVEAAEVVSTRLVPRDLFLQFAPADRGWAFAAGEHEVLVLLADASHREVIDDSMRIEADGASTIGPSAVRLEVPAEGVELRITTGGHTFTTPVAVAGPIDDVELATWKLYESDLMPHLRLRVGRDLCASPLSGGKRVVDSAAIGVFSLDGAPLTTTGRSAGISCALIPEATRPGLYEFGVSFGSVSRTYPLEVLAGH